MTVICEWYCGLQRDEILTRGCQWQCVQLTDDTMDLLDETAMKRALGAAAAGRRGFNSARERDTDDFEMEDGKLVVKELKGRKRGRVDDDEYEGGGGDGSDDDGDDDRRSRGGKSMGDRKSVV